MSTADADAPPTTPPTEPPNVVEVTDVWRSFGDVVALQDLNLRVPKGRITVLLGPNGAGKTTAIRMITGALEVDRGTVSTFGLDPRRDGREIRRRCGVVSAKPALYDRLSGHDNLDYAARLYGLGRDAHDRILDAATRFGIQDSLDQQVGGYSTGMKTRLALARSILHEPDLLLFDEPTSGLDPESSAAVLELIRKMTSEGRTVVMCTHLLVEAEGLADSVVMLEYGTDLLAGPPDQLTRDLWPGHLVRIDAEQRQALDELEGRDGVLSFRRNGHVELELDDLRHVPDIIADLTGAGVRLTRVEPHVPSLEDLYFEVRRRRRAEGIETPL
ncbi:MAG: ABC transporter ATP-binding protein [Acidimicrobiia bacterium]|nr:ABC transporter ATP-binding protein [Acidimicrobiia bacterium]